MEKIIHHRTDRDFVASAQYMNNDGLNEWLAPLLNNKLFRKTILRVAVNFLSILGMTSRMTVWAKKRKMKSNLINMRKKGRLSLRANKRGDIKKKYLRDDQIQQGDRRNRRLPWQTNTGYRLWRRCFNQLVGSKRGCW